MAHLLPLAALLAVAAAHVCLVDPHQRGVLSLEEPGDGSCFRRTPYCGGVAPGAPVRTFHAGAREHVVFQQNLNHWYPQKPGFFDFALAYTSTPTDADWTTLSTIDDYPGNDMVTQTNFSVEILIPAQRTASAAVLRIRYVSYNPLEIYPANNTDAIFYNCADVAIVAQAAHVQETAPAPKAPVRAAVGPSCVSPSRWVAEGRTSSRVGIVTHRIFYDAVAQLVRWERRGNLWNETYNEQVLITNYTDLKDGPPEWVIYPRVQQCLTYGADGFYAWQYGPQNGMAWVRNDTLHDGQVVMIYSNPTNLFEWRVLADGCRPLGITQFNPEHNIVQDTQLDAHVTDSFPPGTFTPPAYCKTPLRHPSCRGSAL